jgi:NAD(P)-dependent dehydrogenase (short-subunit alcohol dehydrogenase family)
MKTAIVTGGSSGLGLLLAQALSTNYDIVNWDINPTDDLLECEYVDVNLMSEDEIEKAVQRIDRPIDLLVNCAGVNQLNFIEGIKVEEWDRIMGVNVRAPWLVVKHMLINQKFNKVHNRRTIVNIISNASHKPMTLSAAYNASKGAAHILTLQMARELMREHGITVFGVSPIRLRGTQMSKQIDARVATLRGKSVPQVWMDQVADMPAGTETDPETCAEFIAYLLSNFERHRYLHGTVIPYGA